MSGDGRAPPSPYKGLAPFDDSELDALLFFGREREIEIVVANLIASRLTVLFGPSGVGKSSLLRAGVVRTLRRLGEESTQPGRAPELAVALYASWNDADPVGGLARAVADAVEQASGEAVELEPGLPLVDVLAALAERVDGHLHVILDQFEEYFLYRDEARDRFADEFAEAVARSGLRVNVVISIREDALAKLDLFQGRIPRLFTNFLRLDHLDRAAARTAILGPIERYAELVPEDGRVDVEPALVDAVLDETAEGRVELAPARGTPAAAADGARIEAPYLQLVMERLWDAEVAAGSRTLRLVTLRGLGGAAEIVRVHLERALATLPAEQKDVAASIFEHLVTPSGGKIAQRLDDLAHYASVDRDRLVPVLSALDRERIVRPLDADGRGSSGRYEIFHDVLADAVLAWRAQRELELTREKAASRQRHLLVLAAASALALAIVAGVAVFAWLERDDARAHARRAEAGEAIAAALTGLAGDPQRSLRLALRAARIERTPTTEDVLRQSLLAVRLRHVLPAGGPVVAASYAPGGGRIVTASADGSARLYDAASGSLLHRLRHGAPLTAAAFDPHGRLVVTAGRDGRALVWQAATGRLLRTLRHAGPVESAAFSSDGTRVVTASADGTARLWPTADGGPVTIFRPGGSVRSAGLSSDGSRVVTVSRTASGAVVATLFAASGAPVRTLPSRGVTTALFSPDGTLVATASADHTASLWSARSGGLLRVLAHGHEGPIEAAAFSADGGSLATAGRDGGTAVWDVPTGIRRLFLLGHTNHVLDVAFSPAGDLVASAGLDGTARVWDTDQGDPVGTLAGHTGAVTGVAFTPDGESIVTASADGTARTWRSRARVSLRPLVTQAGPVTAVAASPDGRLVLSSSVDGTARIVRLRDRRTLWTLRHGAPIADARWSADGGRVVTAGADGTAAIWDVRTGALVRRLRAGAPVLRAAFSPDGRYVLTAGGSSARLWRTDGRPLATLPARSTATDVAFAPDGRLAAVAGADGMIRLWELPSGRLAHELTGHRGTVETVRFSRDGSRLVSAGDDATARIWSVAGGRLERVLAGHAAALTDAEFSPDGSMVATTSVDHDGRLWDTESGALLHLLRGHFARVNAVGFSPDGRWVVTAGPLRPGVWSTRTGQLLFFLWGSTRSLPSASFAADGRTIVTGSEDGGVRTYDCAVCGGVDRLIGLAENELAQLSP